MSCEYHYYLAYRKNGIYYPYSPVSRKTGKLNTIFYTCGYDSSTISEDFEHVKPEDVSDELYCSLIDDYYLNEYRKAEHPDPLTEKDIELCRKLLGKDPDPVEPKPFRKSLEESWELRALPVRLLPKGSFIKEGYVRAGEISANEESGDNDFFMVMTPAEYAARLKAFLETKNEDIVNEWGETYCKLSELVYHKWVDYSSKEYQSFMLREIVEALDCEDDHEDAELVLIETIG